MKRHYALLISALLLAGCYKDTTVAETETAVESSAKSPETGVHLGAHLTNAYAIQYMRQAYTQLYGSGAMTAIQPTHYYAKIDLSNPAVLNLALNDTNIDVFPFPLDYVLVGTGDYIPPQGEERWGYAVIPVGWPHLPEIHPIIIDTCYIPPQDNDRLMAVEERALYNTGNLRSGATNHSDDAVDTAQARAAHKPDGYLRVKNTITGTMDPDRNVKVKINSLVRVKNAYTNNVGYYKSGWKFFTDVYYTVFYENRDHYKLWKNNLCFLPATLFLGKHSNNGYTYNMDTPSAGWLMSTICNATDIYWHDLAPHFNILPPVNGLRIMAIPICGDWAGSAPMFRHLMIPEYADNWNFWRAYFTSILNLDSLIYSEYYTTLVRVVCLSVLPDVFYLQDNISTKYVYNNMFHELSHVSHYAKVGNPYWAGYVTNIIANLGYGDGTSNSEYIGVGEMWGNYSGFVMEKYYWETIRGVSGVVADTVRQLDVLPWCYPDSLRSLVASIDGLNYIDIYDCLVETDTTLCELENEIKLRVNHAYYPRVEKAFENMCNE